MAGLEAPLAAGAPSLAGYIGLDELRLKLPDALPAGFAPGMVAIEVSAGSIASAGTSFCLCGSSSIASWCITAGFAGDTGTAWNDGLEREAAGAPGHARYSQRKATPGAIRVARQAGSQQAAIVAASSTIADAAKAPGSTGCTP